MTNHSPAPLRLFVEELPDEQPGLDLPQLSALCRAFEQTTGWQLRCEQAPAGPGEVWSAAIPACGGQPSMRLVLAPAGDEASAQPTPLDLHRARPLALAVGNLLGEINRLRHALWLREAELAAGVPVAARPDEEPHLAERLEGVLKGGAEAAGCQAAGLYLLDEHTSELKLRAAWNLPPERLLAEARPLRGAVADLEALVGHAVVLEDTSLLPHWRCPEDYPAAVCVPVSSPTMPLGTLWVYSERSREFSPHETNLVEIVAGRLAADLEREMLLAAGVDARIQGQQFDRAARWLSDRLPSIPPLLDEYEVSGWTRPAKGIGGDFYDWSVLPDGRLAVTLGDSEGQLLEAGLGAASLHAAIKSHAGYRHTAGELLSRVNDTLFAASPGDQRAALAYALIEPESGKLELALAGNVGAIVLRGGERQIVTSENPLLGETPDAPFRSESLVLAPGEALLLFSSGIRSATDPAGKRIGPSKAASLAARHLHEPADQIVTRLQQLLDRAEELAEDLTVLVLKRRTV